MLDFTMPLKSFFYVDPRVRLEKNLEPDPKPDPKHWKKEGLIANFEGNKKNLCNPKVSAVHWFDRLEKNVQNLMLLSF